MSAPELPFEMTVEPYRLSGGGSGTYIGQPRFYEYGSETDLRMQAVPSVPGVYVSDDGYVEVDGARMPTDAFLAWAQAVVAAVDGGAA